MSAIGAERLGELYDAHASVLVLYARQLCDSASAEDAVQEAFCALARQRTAPNQVAAWLYRTVRNAALTGRRGWNRRRRREAAASRPEAWFESADDRIDALEATRALAGLDADSRAIVVARLWGGLQFEEVARLHGCSIATAHRRYHDALLQLHERLSRSCPALTTQLNRN